MNFKNDKLFFVIQSSIKYISFDWGIWLRSILYKPFFKSFGKNVQIKDGVTFKYPSEISLGNNLKIGEFSYFVGKGNLKIGDNILIGAGTKIITSNHLSNEIDLPIFDQKLDFKSIVLGNDIWIGFDVKIFGGVVIGNGCIIGANTLINKGEIEPFSVIVGTPYKIIKKRNW